MWLKYLVNVHLHLTFVILVDKKNFTFFWIIFKHNIWYLVSVFSHSFPFFSFSQLVIWCSTNIFKTERSVRQLKNFVVFIIIFFLLSRLYNERRGRERMNTKKSVKYVIKCYHTHTHFTWEWKKKRWEKSTSGALELLHAVVCWCYDDIVVKIYFWL